MMKPKYLRIASDLHIDSRYGQNISSIIDSFLPSDKKDSYSILILAGDVTSNTSQLIDFLLAVEKLFFKVIFIPGNHCYYKHDIDVWDEETTNHFNSTLKNTSFSLGGVGTEVIDDIRYIFTTLWADGGKNVLEQMYVQHGLSDFRVIKKSDRLFSVDDMISIHEYQKDILTAILNESKELNVVITHHLPSYSLCHPRFGTSISGGFASDCDSLMVGGNPVLWVHGHTHDTIDTDLYGTRVICNPYGYSSETNRSQHNKYKKKFVEISSLRR